ncbi:UNVERIFIED_CONTAM: hypothetical protein RMT77_019143 [Armadillidium vulgare]
MDNSKVDSEAPVFTLPSPPKRRVPIMTHEQIYDHLFKELTRYWEKTKEITTEDVLSESKDDLELCLRKLKHYVNGLDFNTQIYKRFFEEAVEDHHLSFIEAFQYLKKFLAREIGLLESQIKLLNELEKKSFRRRESEN